MCRPPSFFLFAVRTRSISDLDDSVFSSTGDVESLPYFEVPCALKIFDDKDTTDKDTDDDDDDNDSSNNEEDGDNGDGDGDDDDDDDDENHTEHYLKPRARLLVSNNLVGYGSIPLAPQLSRLHFGPLVHSWFLSLVRWSIH